MKYQVFSIRARWSEGAPENDWRTRRRVEGLPVGRMWNGTWHYMMPRENTTLEQIETEAREVWWPGWLSRCTEKHRDSAPKNIADLTIDVSFVKRAPWCCGWFSHWTYDIGQSDEDVIDSFYAYVAFTMNEDYQMGRERGIHLMGADERSRWKGPCRCEHCKKAGIVRIDH